MASILNFPTFAPSIPFLGGKSAPTPPTPLPRSPETYAGQRPQGLPSSAQIQASIMDRKQRDALINGMVDSQGPGAPTTAQAEDLRNALGVVDTGVLRFAKNNGVNFGVVKPGSDMFELGVLRPQSVQDYQAGMPAMRALADRYNAVGAPFDQKMAALQKRRDALGEIPPPPPLGGGADATGGFGFSTTLPKLTPLQEKAGKLEAQIEEIRRQKIQAQVKLAQPGQKATPFSPIMPEGPPETATMRAMQMQMLDRANLSTENMAQFVGAKTPQQVKEYNGLVEGINGDRLKTARSEAMRQLEERLAKASPAEKAELTATLNQWKGDPSLIQFDRNKHNIMVPDLYYSDNGKGGQVRLNRHDADTLMGWAGPQGTRTAPTMGAEHPDGSTINGQYFDSKDRILVQSTRLTNNGLDSPTAVHELGHAIDSLVQRKDPEFHKSWDLKVHNAYERVRPPVNPFQSPNGRLALPPETISDYARTNPREYVAEGIANYYEDPKLLKAKDPALFEVVKQLLDRANALGGK